MGERRRRRRLLLLQHYWRRDDGGNIRGAGGGRGGGDDGEGVRGGAGEAQERQVPSRVDAPARRGRGRRFRGGGTRPRAGADDPDEYVCSRFAASLLRNASPSDRGRAAL